ncbi:hypothetical protein N7532_007785 [Penicillium argentinense]|uniref:Uncharacterized protein n=1 Tax=Penicillium argentinense TaxID=1131581 RepID=A0A9W9K1D7_9EURO|nr:uncharacterized protein N7532_007785 [Penicillium argentinense]KAJ5089101.1 hypothetical protein N7532_007785 [Penicillium argentinense]
MHESVVEDYMVIKAQEKAWEEASESDMLEVLEEALICTKCQITVTEAIMKLDVDNGAYIDAHYPPFFANTRTRDDNISPLHADSSKTKYEDPSWWRKISFSQRERYYAMVEENLNRSLNENKDIDPEVAVLFAHYQVDYHIRQHYLARRGVLSLCRNASDLQDLRTWQWDMAAIDRINMGKDIDVSDPDEGWLPEERQWGWPGDRNLEKAHQVPMWKRNSPVRRKRLRAVRAKWAIIMEERRKQREELLKKTGTTVTVRLYLSGDLMTVRELPRVVEVESGMRLGKKMKSSTF